MKVRRRRRTAGWLGALIGSVLLLAACGEPIVPRSPEALYALAKEQLANANYSPALDTLGRVMRAGPDTEPARRSRLLHLSLLGGLARGYKEMAESYLAGSEHPGAAAYASQMRSMAMDYFGRARGRSLEMVEALDRLLREPPTVPLRLDYARPVAVAGSATLASVRQGNWVADAERVQAEREKVLEGLAGLMAGLAGEPGKAGTGAPADVREFDPAGFYLGAARELLSMSGLYRPQALKDPRLFRLYHQRALAAAERASELARARGDAGRLEESQRLEEVCRQVLKKS